MSELAQIVRQPRGARTDHALYTSSFWLGTLATSIHGHLHGAQPADRLGDDLREFVESPACSAQLRAMLGDGDMP